METPADRNLSLLVGSDLHNSGAGLDWFCELALKMQPDAVVFLGDFVTGGPVSFIREAAGALRSLPMPGLVVPGNHDPRESIVELDKAAFDGLHHLHKRSAYIGGYSFAGLGGSVTTPKGLGQLEAPDDGFAAPLVQFLPVDIWVLHCPLKGLLDQLESGLSIGSESLHAVWRGQSAPPLLVLSGHAHASAGHTINGATNFVNPGPLTEKTAAKVELFGNVVDVKRVER